MSETFVLMLIIIVLLFASRHVRGEGAQPGGALNTATRGAISSPRGEGTPKLHSPSHNNFPIPTFSLGDGDSTKMDDTRSKSSKHLELRTAVNEAKQALTAVLNTSKKLSMWQGLLADRLPASDTEHMSGTSVAEGSDVDTEELDKDYYLGPPYPPVWKRRRHFNLTGDHLVDSSYNHYEKFAQENIPTGGGGKTRGRYRRLPPGYSHDGSQDYVKYQVLPGTEVMYSTNEEKIEIVNLHNEYRRKEGANNMEHMVWDDELAKEGFKRAEICVFYHDFFKPFGQNLAVTSKPRDTFTWSRMIMLWMNEKPDWDYNTRKCNAKMCGHYTQVVWSKSRRIGCLKSFCPKIQNSYFTNAMYAVCQYAPYGNLEDTNPLSFGPPCTECYSGHGWCMKDLCMDHMFCLTKPDQCKCPLKCENCGDLEDYICFCSCMNGWDGIRCTNPCQNSNKEKCTNQNGGYFKDQCRNAEYGESVTGMCRAMCNKCVEGTPPTCSKTTVPKVMHQAPPPPDAASKPNPDGGGTPGMNFAPGGSENLTTRVVVTTPTTTVITSSSPKEEETNNTAIIAVIVGSAIVLLIILGIIVYMYYRQVKKRWSGRPPRRFSQMNQ